MRISTYVTGKQNRSHVGGVISECRCRLCCACMKMCVARSESPGPCAIDCLDLLGVVIYSCFPLASLQVSRAFLIKLPEHLRIPKASLLFRQSDSLDDIPLPNSKWWTNG